MPPPKKPDLPFEPEHDYLEGPAALQAIQNLSPNTNGRPQQSNNRQSRRIELDPRFIAALTTAASVDPNRLQAQPTEILMRIIEVFLEPQDAVALALTNHLFMEIVPWALQTPFKLICPPDSTNPSLAWFLMGRHSSVSDYFALRSSIAQIHKNLFRYNLRDSFGPTYIYCGLPRNPAMRDIMPVSDFRKTATDHLGYCCMTSLELREEQLSGPMQENWKVTNTKKHIKSIKYAVSLLLRAWAELEAEDE